MKAIFLILLVNFCVFSAEFNMSEYRSSLISVQDNIGTIKDDSSIIVGSSGVVLHSFGDGLKSIIARVVVDEKNEINGSAKVHFEVYSGLKQNALPLPNYIPQAGDEVILNYLYNRSLIVVPNVEIYNQVIDVFKNISFIHPDLLGAVFSIEYTPNPKKEDFKKACAINAAGLVFIALDNEAVFVDCGSFDVIKSFKSGKVASYDLPFYTRVKNIKPVFWKLDSEYIADYNTYYRNLIYK